MIELNGHDIRISKGDTAQIGIVLSADEIIDGATAIITMKRKPGDVMALWEKTVPVENGQVTLKLDTADTNRKPGEYWWDVRLKLQNGTVYTPFKPGRLIVYEVVGDV